MILHLQSHGDLAGTNEYFEEGDEDEEDEGVDADYVDDEEGIEDENDDVGGEGEDESSEEDVEEVMTIAYTLLLEVITSHLLSFPVTELVSEHPWDQKVPA